jgi:hypothetical protein
MNRNAQRILDEACQLPPEDLQWLVESLLIKGYPAPEAEIEAAWQDEIKHRLDQIDSGAVELIPGELVRAEIVQTLSEEARTRLRV